MSEHSMLDQLSAWVEIDTDAIIHNLNRIRETINTDTKILAVVKANAYGLGQNEIARVLERSQVDYFGVTNLLEGIGLRQGGITSSVVLFAPLLDEQISTALEYDLIPSISSINQLQELQDVALSKNLKPKIHIKLETGMGRTGLWIEDIPLFIQKLKNCPNVIVEGMYSHLANAGLDTNFSEKQFAIFQKGLELFQDEGIEIPIKHLANSIGSIKYPHMCLDMVRVGNLLLGQIPIGINFNDIKDPWQVKSKIINIRELPPGCPIGYGSEFVTKRKSKIGIISIGSADGFSISPKIKAKGIIDLMKILAKDILAYFGKGSNALVVQYENKNYPVVGRIGMQLSMVDLTGSNAEKDHTVNISLRRINAPQSLPRVYLKDKQPYGIFFAKEETLSTYFTKRGGYYK